MYAYKIASHMGQDQYKREIVIDKLEVLIHQFDNRLSHPNLVHILAEGENSRELPLNLLYYSIAGQWESEFKPILTHYIEELGNDDLNEDQLKDLQLKHQKEYLSLVDHFIFNITNLVTLIEENTETRIQLLRDIEYIALPLLLLAILATPLLLYFRILLPLRDLLEISQLVRQHEFSRQAHYLRKDELGEVGHAFNLMTTDLSATYAELEDKVIERTNDLIQEANRITMLEERSNIAQELHDSIAQSVFYMRMQISRIKTLCRRQTPLDELIPIIEELSQSNDDNNKQLRELISTFRIEVNPAGLTVALEDIIKRYSERGDTDLKFENRVPEFKFSHNEEVHLIQITQEAVSNIIKHANAQQGVITLKHDRESNKIILTIRDDGVGIPENPERPNHFGLKTMQERGESMHGKIKIVALPTRGTKLTLKFHPALTQEAEL